MSNPFDHEDYHIHANYYECDANFTVEELYQAFKERILEDIAHELLSNLPE